MTVEQYVMLMTAWSVIKTKEGKNSYRYAGPIPHIICKDGYIISVQCHGGAHCEFEKVPQEGWYSTSFGKKLLKAETNCAELNAYGINTIDDIEKFVESHGGIDLDETVRIITESAIRKLKGYY